MHIASMNMGVKSMCLLECILKFFAFQLKQVKPSITNEVETWYEKIKEGVSNVIPKESDRTFYG